ncbi:MAG: hepatocellular carcinoma-associated antigen 59-domain-containing protein [Olpidium bornovanus]|uniref:Hepatocellular carcinoma-associated antigen 59-domain-containing protein n=1 Tax=Olpidium bornovanus TaxID=278681 RepID=A0A8H7ZNJ5_9FUNG|nr:MAG: hepatocellular carcinoma-associated antigen 59-domain-containing protein [Olpidium bornovanus]
MPPKTAHDAARRRRNYRTKQPASASAACDEGGALAAAAAAAGRPPAAPEEEEEPPACGQKERGGPPPPPPEQQQQQDEAESPPRAADAAVRGGAVATSEKDDDAPETGCFRRLRKRKHGIDAEKLQKGESKKKRSKAGPILDGSAPAGAGVADQAAGAEDEEKESRVIKDNFTKQTNALDVDKHMMAYIESQLQKRRGARSEAGEEEEVAGADPRDELFRTPDYLKVGKTALERVEVEKQKEKEENVTQSTAMLTAIPEVDLGIEYVCCLFC